jgi:uncharacterized protein (TIGR03032 family)
MSTPPFSPDPPLAEEKSIPLSPPAPDQTGLPASVICQHTRSLPYLLEETKCSVLISTYMIGNVAAVGAREGKIYTNFHTFDRPMGMTVSPDGIVVSGRNQIWFMPKLLDIAPQMEPRGQYDLAYFVRRSHFTGNILCHEIGWVGRELWIVNTRFSCLCTFHHTCHFDPRWHPPFISELTPEDRCHLNGMATFDRQARYVTALAETNTREGWRPVKATSGCIIDVANNAVISRGLAMPHSPRIANGQLYVLHSGMGQLEVVDPASGRRETVCELPGYIRGMAIHGSLAFVGLSKIRPSSTMDGVPIAARRDQLKCGVWVVDLTRGTIVGHLEFVSGIDELFDVQVLPGVAVPFLSGPLVDTYLDHTNWTMPPRWKSARSE